MSRHPPLLGRMALVVLAALAGCQPQQPFYLRHVDCDLAHYKGVATEIDYPDVDSCTLGDASDAKRPFSLTNPSDKKDVWDLSLEEALAIALKNSKVIKGLGASIEGAPEFLLRNFVNPEFDTTVYGPALAESDPRGGVEAALSAFDAQFSSSLMWERTNAPQNVSNRFVEEGFANVSEHDISKFQTQLSKVAATGGQFSLTHTVAYDKDRFPYAVFTDPTTGQSTSVAPYAYPSDWNVNLQAEFRQPLLQGAGVEFNRIAGPGALPGQYNGVVLARINTDIALADFEAGVRNLVNDIETAYWELYFQYRNLDAVIAGRDSALSTWRKVYTLYRIGGKGGEAEKEAQAREQYYLFRSNAENALNSLYATEAKLRYLLGIAATDGRLIRPKDEPTTAKIVFDWCEVLSEGLARSVELRQQKWIVKKREMELIAAKNFLLPKLDFDAQYRWLGLGNDLFPERGDSGADFHQPNSSAYESLSNGHFQEWQLGFELKMPFGFRREMAGVRNAQLKLARERAKLQEGELELSHQLAWAIRELDRSHVLSQTEFNRRIAAQREVEAVTAAYETDTVTIDRVLEAQRALALAESDFYRAVVDYNKSIAGVHNRKGSLLEYNGVYLAEGPWPGKAYFDARRRARARDAGTYLDYGFTQPKVISRGPIQQDVDGACNAGQPMDPGAAPSQTPSGKQPELVPTPDASQRGVNDVPAEPQTSKAAAKGRAVGVAVQLPPQRAGAGQALVGAAVELPPQRAVRPQRILPPPQESGEGPVVAPSGWVAAGSGGYDEPGANPATATGDRPAQGWKGKQY